ncbi:MAG: lamin tail domain-containing protein [Planctomycetota bacterium]
MRLQRLEHRNLLAAEILLSEFMASNDETLVDGDGLSSDWIEIHNAGDEPESLAGWHLTDDPAQLSRWTFPDTTATTLAPGDFLVVFASGKDSPDAAGNLHTNFSLSAAGEYIALVRPSLEIVNEFGPGQSEYPAQRTDISYGVDPDVIAGDATRYFLTPTPNAPNTDSVLGFVEDTEFSVDRGFYSESFSVDVTSSTLGATIVYTFDGSEPTLSNGTQVVADGTATPTATVTIPSTTTLRAAAFKTDHLPTNIDTQTYLFLDDVLAQPDAPAGFPNAWGSAPAADYEMDPEITTDPSYTADLLAGLRELPTLSLVSDTDGLFGSSGIYSNPRDETLEIATSAEYILADGNTGFQIDAGLEIAGGASRRPNNSPKHSMSLRFRSQYGAAKLNYDLFDESPVDTFNSLQLRAVYNNSWIHWDQGQRGRGTLIRDQFIRDSLIAAGQDDAGRGHYTHVYLNGLYWGVYNLHERADSSHFAEYQGGDAADYDALNGGAPIDGTIDSWNNVKATVASGDWTAIQKILDVDNVIDWALVQAYGGNADLKINGNWRAAGGGDANALWRLYAWDSERVLEDVTAKPPHTLTDATGLFDDLLQVPEFLVRYGDRAQEHLTGEGALTPEKLTQRWNARADQLRNAIVAESARWGDYRRDVHPRGETPLLYRRDQNWTPEIDRLVSEYFPARTDWLLSQLVAIGWLPSTAAPQFRIDGEITNGGLVPSGTNVRLTADAESIYYTTDGTDPRLEGGAVAPNAISYDTSVTTTTLINAGVDWKYEDGGTDLGTAWREPGFDDASWFSGAAQLGFGDGDEATLVSFGTDPNDKHRTTYFRHSFDSEPLDATALTMRLRRDDGAVVYLNGVEVVRDNLPAGDVTYTTLALAAAPDDGNDWLRFDIPLSLLIDGLNTVAVEIHQNSPNSSDLSFDLELLGELQTGPPILVNESTLLSTRARSAGGEWSVLQDTLFRVPNEAASTDNLRVTEIHYDPAVDGDAEFLEFRNVSPEPTGSVIELGGVSITDGPSSPFVFPLNTLLAPGESAVIVRNIPAFTAAYPNVDSSKILGEYAGKLSNSGERIRIVDALGSELLDISYGTSDPWPEWSDGLGGSLVLAQPNATPVSELGKASRYRESVEIEGTPAAAEQSPSGVWISEVLAHTDSPLVDAIELFNSTSEPIDVGDWYLSDDGSSPEKYRIPTGTTIPAGGFLVFDEADFNPSQANSDSMTPFALSGSRGDSVWLFTGDGTAATGFADHVAFDATFNGTSLGRLDGSQGRLVPLSNRSLGDVNGMFLPSDIFVSEFNYHPADPASEALAVDPSLTSRDLEFVEISNASEQVIDLQNWKLSGEAEFDFQLETPLPANETLTLVSFDPNDSTKAEAFRTHYGINEELVLTGPFTGSLNNSFGVLKLQAPDDPPSDDPNVIPAVTVDEVFYDDRSPWPVEADGAGSSLQRLDATTLGMFWGSWRAETPTPGNLPQRPLVESVSVNRGEETRSSVTVLEVQFDRLVDVDTSSIVLVHRETGQTVDQLQVTTDSILEKTRATIRFGDGPLVVTRPVGNSLIDGNFELRVVAEEVRLQGTGTTMARDSVFGDAMDDGLFRFFGDGNGDRDVDGQDFGAFASAFLLSDDDPGFDSRVDFDGDGDIDGQDYGPFAERFLKTLAFV